jgi:hypothetical protein
MYRRPARDRNYEFWGDQTFFGENPPQAAVISWHQKRQVGEVKLRIADAAGREVREISGRVLANSTKPGLQSACWDLRVQPAPAPAGRGGQGGGRQGGRGGEQEEEEEPPQDPFGAGCGGGGGGGGRGRGGFGGGGSPGPFVLPGVYQVSLVIDGKTAGTKPLRVMADPEVVLTDAERKRLFDMAMEMHALQRQATEAANALAPFNTRMAEIVKEIEGRSDLPADVKTSFDMLNKELAALAPKLAPPAGGRGRGGGRGGAGDSVLGRIGQAKNGMMGGMWPTEQTLRAYTQAKADVPKVIAEAHALFTKAAAVSAVLAKHNITLTVPATPTRPSSDGR